MSGENIQQFGRILRMRAVIERQHQLAVRHLSVALQRIVVRADLQLLLRRGIADIAAAEYFVQGSPAICFAHRHSPDELSLADDRRIAGIERLFQLVYLAERCHLAVCAR